MKTIHKHVTMFFAQQRNTVSFYLQNRAISRTFVIQSDNLVPWVPEVFLARRMEMAAEGRWHERRSREKNLWLRAAQFTVLVEL